MRTAPAVSAVLAALSCAVLAPAAAHSIQVRTVPQAINDLVYNPTDGYLYASVPGAVQNYPNTILRIDVATGAIVASVPVGSEPRDLALADDGRTLYVGLDGAAAIRRVDVSTMTAGAQFSLGSDSFTGPYYAEDIEVMPGNPNVVAVSLRNAGFSPRHEGVAIFDNGIARPARTPDHTGSNVIEFGASATRLYGYNNETTEFGFRRMSVTSSGVTVLESTQNLISGFWTDIHFFGGRVYATTGQVVDPESRTLLGTFPFPDFSYGRAVAAAANRVYYATGEYGYGTSARMHIFDPATFASIVRFSIPGVSGFPAKMVRAGTGRMALRTEDATRFYLLDDVDTPPTADLLLSLGDAPDPVTVDNYLTYSAEIRNHGEAAAEQTVFRLVRPPTADFGYYYSNRGYCYDSLGVVVCPLGLLVGGDSVWVQVNVIPRVEGTIEAHAFVVSNTLDADSSNQQAAATTTVRAAGWDAADLFVRFTAPPDSQMIAGREYVHLLELGNRGPAVATGVRIGTSIYGDSAEVAIEGADLCSGFSGGVVCSLGTIAPGGIRTLTVRLRPLLPGFLGVNHTVFGEQVDANYGDNGIFTWSVVLPSADRLLEALLASVEAIGLKGGTGNLLEQSILRALESIQSEDTTGCCDALDQFQKRVEHRAGRGLTLANAFALQNECAYLQAILGCGGGRAESPRGRGVIRLDAAPRADGPRAESEDESAPGLPSQLGIAPVDGAPSAMALVSMPRAGRAKIELLDVQGRVVRDLYDGDLAAGVQRVWWGGPQGGEGISSGVYFYRVTAHGQQSVAKAVLVK